MPTVWTLPRSFRRVTGAGLMSTTATLTHAGSSMAVASECSVVAIISAKPTPWISSRICCRAACMPVTTSGSGPSSRMLPARTNGS